MTESDIEKYEERAAIIEYHGGKQRHVAERLAREQLKKQPELFSLEPTRTK